MPLRVHGRAAARDRACMAGRRWPGQGAGGKSQQGGTVGGTGKRSRDVKRTKRSMGEEKNKLLKENNK